MSIKCLYTGHCSLSLSVNVLILKSNPMKWMLISSQFYMKKSKYGEGK